MASLDAAELRRVLDYDSETGVFRWKDNFHKRRIGTIAGGRSVWGYTQIKVHDWQHKAHRLAWLWMTGEWPEQEIDHINHDKADNRWCNLRAATAADNARNRNAIRGKMFGKGVRRRWGRYHAEIEIEGKCRFLGAFDSQEEASAAFLAAAKATYGEFAHI